MAEEKKGSVSENFLEEEISLDIQKNQLIQLGKEFFPDRIEKKTTEKDFNSVASRFYSFNLPAKYQELLVDFKTCKYLPVSNFPVFIKFEEWLKNQRKEKSLFYENYNEIKKFYKKWMSEQTNKEREYFGLTALQQIDRNSAEFNIPKYILAAIIYAFDPKFFSAEKALEEIQTASSKITEVSIDNKIKQDFKYYIELYLGIVLIKTGDYERASGVLSEASRENGSSVSSHFFNAVAAKNMQNLSEAARSINEIFKSDIKRFEYAIESDNIELFLFFLDIASTYSIFRDENFVELQSEIKTILESFPEQDEGFFRQLRAKIQEFKDLDLGEYIDEDIKKDIDFILKFIDKLGSKHNLFVSIVSNKLVEKFKNVIDKTLNKVKAKHAQELGSKLEVFKEYKEEEENKIGRISDELREAREQLKAKKEMELDDVGRAAEKMISDTEDKMSRLESSPKYDSKKAFFSAMTNNVIVSIIMVIIGGFAGGVGEGSGEDFAETLSSFLISGVKWGGIVFLLGSLISVIVAVSASMDAVKERKKMLKRISFLRNKKEREIEKTKRIYDQKLASLEKSFDKKLKDANDDLDAIDDEKKEREGELKSEMNEEIQQISAKLEKIMPGITNDATDVDDQNNKENEEQPAETDDE